VKRDSNVYDEISPGELGSPALQSSVLKYLDKYPAADGDAIATNLSLTLAFMALKDALTEYLVPYGLGLTRAEYNLLAILHLADDKSRALSEIAREMGVTPTWVTKLLDALEAQGLAERVVNPADRRVTYAHLTPEGEARCVLLVPAFLKFMQEVGQALSADERSELRRLLEKYKMTAESLSKRKD
jgi:DNA-binding MarR family transcriptional regulator